MKEVKRLKGLKQVKPQPDHMYDALIDLLKNGLPPPAGRTQLQQDAYDKKVLQSL